MSEVAITSLVPPRQKGLPLFSLMKRYLSHITPPESWSLHSVFTILFPQYPLVLAHHEALIDATKLYLVTKAFIQLFKPLEQNCCPMGFLNNIHQYLDNMQPIIPTNKSRMKSNADQKTTGASIAGRQSSQNQGSIAKRSSLTKPRTASSEKQMLIKDYFTGAPKSSSTDEQQISTGITGIERSKSMEYHIDTVEKNMSEELGLDDGLEPELRSDSHGMIKFDLGEDSDSKEEDLGFEDEEVLGSGEDEEELGSDKDEYTARMREERPENSNEESGLESVP